MLVLNYSVVIVLFSCLYLSCARLLRAVWLGDVFSCPWKDPALITGRACNCNVQDVEEPRNKAKGAAAQAKVQSELKENGNYHIIIRYILGLF